ncbi:hypothetical protein JCM11641_000744 [Rhodosporidiobolus odoratus]
MPAQYTGSHSHCRKVGCNAIYKKHRVHHGPLLDDPSFLLTAASPPTSGHDAVTAATHHSQPIQIAARPPPALAQVPVAPASQAGWPLLAPRPTSSPAVPGQPTSASVVTPTPSSIVQARTSHEIPAVQRAFGTTAREWGTPASNSASSPLIADPTVPTVGLAAGSSSQGSIPSGFSFNAPHSSRLPTTSRPVQHYANKSSTRSPPHPSSSSPVSHSSPLPRISPSSNQRMNIDRTPSPPSGAFAGIAAVGTGVEVDEPFVTLQQRYRHQAITDEAASNAAAEAAADATAEAEVEALINEVDAPGLESDDEGEEVGAHRGLRNGAPADVVVIAVPAVPVKGKPRQKMEDGEETERERRARGFETKLEGASRIPDDKKRRARYNNVGHAINRLIRLADVETGGFFAFWTALPDRLEDPYLSTGPPADWDPETSRPFKKLRVNTNAFISPSLVHLGKYNQLDGTEATAIDTCQDFYNNFEAMTTTARDKHAGARVARKAAADLRRAEADRIRLEKEVNTERDLSSQLRKESAQEKAKLAAVLAFLTPEARAAALAAAEAAGEDPSS